MFWNVSLHVLLRYKFGFVCTALFYVLFVRVVSHTLLHLPYQTCTSYKLGNQKYPPNNYMSTYSIKKIDPICWIFVPPLILVPDPLVTYFGSYPLLPEKWTLPSLSVMEAAKVLFTNPSARAGYDTRSIFKRSLTGLNSEFSFS